MKPSTYRLFFARAAATPLFVVWLLALHIASPLAADEPQPYTVDPTMDQEKSDGRVALAEALVFNHLVTCSNSLIGVDAIQVDDVLRSHLGLAVGQGVVVTSVADDSPASRAGLQKNDVLVTVGDQPITGVEGLQNLLQAAVDKASKLGLIRSGHEQSVEVTPQSQVQRLSLTLSSGDPLVAVAAPHFWLGVGLASADDTLRSHLGVAAGEGLVVTSVETDSPAAKAGVMVNDVVLKLDDKPLTTVEGLTAQLQQIGGKSVSLGLLRRGRPATLSVTPEQRAVQSFNVHYVENLGELTFTSVAEYSPVVLGPLVDFVWPEQQPPDLAKQVADLLEQVKQLQKSLEEVKRLQQSLEALDAAIKAQSPSP